MCTSHGEYFEVDGGNLWIRPDVYVKTENDNFTSAVLELTVVSHLIGDKAIREAFAGSGSTVESATGEAFGKFLLGTFHVLIEALTSHTCESAQAEIEHWGSIDGGWRVFSGPQITQHSSGSLLSTDYGAFFSRFQVLFESEVASGPHWVRVFLAAFEEKVIGGEVLLNNERWEAAERLLFEFPWKCAREYQSIRHFMLAFPKGPKSGALLSKDGTQNSKKKPWWRIWQKV
jgi:hypothetical protein